MEKFVFPGWKCQCGKLQWKDKHQARETLRRMIRNGARRNNRAGVTLEIYQSCDGTGWHVGHVNRRRSGRDLNERFPPGGAMPTGAEICAVEGHQPGQIVRDGEGVIVGKACPRCGAWV